MGSGKFSYGDTRAFYSAHVSSVRDKSTEEIFRAHRIHADLDPKGVKVRESRDSVDNPESRPIIVALDVTGSMGMLADHIAREGLGTLFNGILDTSPVKDPHVMFMGIGDAHCDTAPLQVSQFEADHRIIQQLAQLYLEKGGGGNDSESYSLPWYFAAFHTVHDAMEKRGKKGYLFTVGDECTPDPLTPSQIKHFIGDDVQHDLTAQQLLECAQRVYDVYHVVILEGSYARHHQDEVRRRWSGLLGQKVIYLADHTRLPEVIVSAIRIAEGASPDVAAGHWEADKGAKVAQIVHDAVKHLPGPSA